VQNPLKKANALHHAFQNAHRANQSRAFKRLTPLGFFKILPFKPATAPLTGLQSLYLLTLAQ